MSSEVKFSKKSNKIDPRIQNNKEHKELVKRSIFLSNIPPRTNSLSHLFNHFKRFGHIDAIYTSGAHTTITFETEEAANAAYESPLTVLHNRFIKISKQRDDVPATTNFEMVVDMDEVHNAVKLAVQDMNQEAKETEELRKVLHKESKQRRTDKINTLLSEYKKEIDKMLDEANGILNNVEQLPDDEEKSSRNRLASLNDLIKATQNKIDEKEREIKVLAYPS